MYQQILFIISLIASLVYSNLNAQITVVNNGILTVKEDQLLHINGDLFNYSSQFSNRGDIGLTGNFLNEVSVTNPGSGIFRFIGFQQQRLTLFDTMSMFHVNINNMDGLLMDGVSNLQVFGNMDFKDGIAYTNTSSMISFQEEASSNNGNEFSHIDGPTLKFGQNSFVFPIGKNGYFRPATISDIEDSATYLMEYFHASYFTNLKDFDILKVNDEGYWNLQKTNGLVDPKLSIIYDATSNIFSNPENISIVHFGDIWQTVPSFSDGSAPRYSLITNDKVTNYGFFTTAQKQGEFALTLNQNEECEIEVTWVMPPGTLIGKYEVEYSYDSLYFTYAGEVPGKEERLVTTTAYQLTDPVLHEASKIFYRVKMFTPDSIPWITYTPTVSIENNCQFEDCVLFPNPVSSDADMKFQVTSEEAMEMPLQVYDELGRFLFKQTLVLEEGKHIYDVYTKKYKLPSAVYFLYINPKKSLKFVVITK